MLIRIKQGFRKLKFSLDLRHELAADTLKNQTKNNHQMIAIEQLKEVGKIWLAWVRLQDHDPAEVTQIFEKLKEKNIFVRYFNQPLIDNYLRISIGTDEQMEKLYAALEEITGQVK